MQPEDTSGRARGVRIGRLSNRWRPDAAEMEQSMCVWDGTYMAPEAEREAMEQVPGWADDEAHQRDRRDRLTLESTGPIRWTTPHQKAA